MKINAYINDLIKNKDGRKAIFFIRILLGYRDFEFLNTYGLDVGNFETLKIALKYLLERRRREDTDNLLTAMEFTERNILPSSSFSWFINDENACAFFWGILRSRDITKYIRDINEMDSGFYLSKFNGNEHKNWFELLSIEDIQSSHLDRFYAITHFLDCSIFFDHTKKMLMDKVKEKWHEESQKVKEMTWLSNGGRDAAIWVWEYLKKYDDKERREYSYGGINTLELFNPSGKGELPLVIYAALRSWSFRHRSERRMLLSDMKKAWGQRAYRKGRSHIKILNCELDIDVKNHLDELAQTYNKTIVDMVTELIEKEYHGQK
ncbi:hypothetical protein [Providencia rettgeri]|uniref:hypothetical protein n=1 Tax=Providencia rettgeri TaxID=587 RepID=UPI0015D55B87|nr:hypothetical protein [Providencia rettgeri]MDH2377386.1 hypothetical protein [Providencia rettgeri]QLI96563.1 hypothetical protein H0A34_05795 [Providencia rettgeri]